MSNKAAWLTAAKAHPLSVDSAPDPVAGPNEIVVRNAAVAINPVDWKIQDYDIFLKKYPAIIGTDIAGEVVEVGDNVTRFKKGQRVIGHSIQLATGENKHGAFQLYTVVQESNASPIPDSLKSTSAVVLPLAISTASAGLYQKAHLGLPYPSKDPKPAGKTLLVWGGASSVGSTVIQLAVASGVKVVATASSKSHDYVKSMGASQVFDYSKSSVVDDIVSAMKGDHSACIYDAISVQDSVKACIAILEQLGGGKIATTLPATKDVPQGIEVKDVYAPLIFSAEKDVGDYIWGKYVPEALANGSLKATPEALVAGNGLENVQTGFERQKAGVSAAKVVVTL